MSKARGLGRGPGLKAEVELADNRVMSRQLDVAIKIAESHSAREVNSKISARMKASVKDAGDVEGLRAAILSRIARENYDGAIEDLKSYIESKNEYPQFKVRSERYLNYAIDLVNAIRAKRSFPGVQHLSMSKQQELFDRAMEHFEDLKVTLKKVDAIEREVRLEDVRSTVMFVKAAIYCVFAIVILAFLLEASHGLLPTIGVVVDDTFGSLVNWLFDKAGM